MIKKKTQSMMDLAESYLKQGDIANARATVKKFANEWIVDGQSLTPDLDNLLK